MKTIILAGGRGTRLSEETDIKPKPMVKIGPHPMLWHIMNIYAAYGYQEFAIALGYKGKVIKDFFSRRPPPRSWEIHLVPTGFQTGTGGRIRRLAPYTQNETFMMTYGDGVANVNIKKLLAFHRKHGKLATVLAVRPPARFGRLELNGNHVKQFTEKPQMGEGWINGGFFILEPQVLDYIANDKIMFEREPLEVLARKNQLVAYRHHNFWQCVDTLRDLRLLNNLWKKGHAPWKIWK